MVNSTWYLTNITMMAEQELKFTVYAGEDYVNVFKTNVGYPREATTFGLAHTMHVNEDSPCRSYLEQTM